MPTIKYSPWAKLTISMTPKMMVSPRATMASTMPNSRPDTRALSKISMNGVLYGGQRYRVQGSRKENRITAAVDLNRYGHSNP